MSDFGVYVIVYYVYIICAYTYIDTDICIYIHIVQLSK